MFAIKFSIEKRIKKFWTAGFFLPAINATVFSTETNDASFPVLVLGNGNSIESTACKDKISTKKCKKLKKKGKCEDKKTWKKCMETCQKCTPGIID